MGRETCRNRETAVTKRFPTVPGDAGEEGKERRGEEDIGESEVMLGWRCLCKVTPRSASVSRNLRRFSFMRHDCYSEGYASFASISPHLLHVQARS